MIADRLLQDTSEEYLRFQLEILEFLVRINLKIAKLFTFFKDKSLQEIHVHG